MTSTGSATPQRRRPLRSTVAAILALTALTSASLTGISLAAGPTDVARAAAGNPGTPSAPRVLYQEDFTNGQGVQSLQNYRSDANGSYTADDYWLSAANCNGFVLSYQNPNPDTSKYCTGGNQVSPAGQFNLVRAKAYALGQLNDPADSTTNRALSANSNGPTVPTNGVEFQTVQPLNLPSANGRFVTFSVDAAATDCQEAHPLLRFYFKNAAGVETPVSSAAIDPCTSAGAKSMVVPGLGLDSNDPINTVYYGRFAANGSTLLSGGSVGVVMRNEQTKDNGNDGAIDNVRVLDVTPQLDKQFSPTRVETGGTSTLTFTVTNTSELAAKNGWSFTDSLPAGLTVANPNQLGGTCVGTKTAAAGGTQVAITGGQLAAGQASCTVTVQVTSAKAGSFTNNADNVTETGLDPPGSTTVTFTDPSYTVSKSVNATTAIPGKAITYSVQVKNTGEWAYDSNAPVKFQQASFTDDLSNVLDDATYNGDASNGATVAGDTLQWSGPLAVGETKTITYSVTPKTPGGGNLTLNNKVTPPPGSTGSCVSGECTTSTPVQSLEITKTADQTDVIPGSTITYTITVKNTGKVDYTTGDNAASFTDDMSKVLDDATWNDDVTASAGTTSYASPNLSWFGPLATGATATIKYSVKVKDPDSGNQQLDNTVTSTTPGSNCAAGNTDPRCVVLIPAASYTVQKTASTKAVNPGDTATYTVTVENTGRVAYTTERPAAFKDDLSKVLDDASYNGDATNGATVAGNTLSWSGPLAVGASTTVTYSVTVKNPDTGDKTITNAVTPTGPGGRCVTAADCTTTTGVRSYTTTKTSSKVVAHEGDVVTYTVTVTNTGTAAYTGQNLASFSDDLSKVTDDATYNGDATQGATVTGNTVSWSGQLAVGQTIQVTYSVTVNTPDTGDKVLTNAVVPTEPGGSCSTPGDCITDTPVQSFTVEKRSSPETTVPGGTVTYTVRVKNTGGAAYTSAVPATFTDDMSKVLDDATYNGNAVSNSDGTDPGVVTFTSPKLTWTGPLGKGATVTVTYTVTVHNPNTGDNLLTNVVTTDPKIGGTCAAVGACETNTPVQSIVFKKTSDAVKVTPGEKVTYTITATNTGQVAFDNAKIDDSLKEVLDDATYNGDVKATTGTVSYKQPTLSWSGPVAIGQTVTITYSVTVNTPDTGDKILDNAVVSPTPGSNCTPSAGQDPDCRVVVPSGSFTVQKTASTTTATQGSTVSYTVTVKNTGKVAYTAASPASFTDNMVDVLDDATYNQDATATAGKTAYQRPILSWSGPLEVGGTVTVRYSVTVNAPDTGDRKLINVIPPPSGGGSCATVGGCSTTTDVSPGFAVHTGGTATAAVVPAAGWWGVTGMGIAALLGCAVMWFRRRVR